MSDRRPSFVTAGAGSCSFPVVASFGALLVVACLIGVGVRPVVGDVFVGVVSIGKVVPGTGWTGQRRMVIDESRLIDNVELL